MLWLIQHETALEMQRARELGLHRHVTEAQRAEFTSRTTALGGGVPRNYQVAGDVAEIRVEGVLTQKPDFFAYYFGGGNTTWESIQQALALAQADTNVKRISWLMNSPGGMIDGMFDTLAAVQACTKPMSVRASMACSAAYTLAAICGKIEATNAAAYFGSVGVVRSYYVDEHIVEVTNTEAPNKRPDPETPEGKATIQGELDAIADLMHEAIAGGRATTVRDVVQNFGRGGTVLAGDAKRRGMIDKIAKPALRALPVEATTREERPEQAPAQTKATAPDPGAPTAEKETPMNKQELKDKHPEVYASIVAEGRAEATAAGEKAERDRVVAHLTLGEASGDMKTAVEAITSGEGMTATINAKYMAASMNRNAVAARQTESDKAGEALDGAKPDAEASTPKDGVDPKGAAVVAAAYAQSGKPMPEAVSKSLGLS